MVECASEGLWGRQGGEDRMQLGALVGALLYLLVFELQAGSRPKSQ